MRGSELLFAPAVLARRPARRIWVYRALAIKDLLSLAMYL